jgi:Domain of unknown function (DUF1929)/IPT/TIG domain
MCLSLFKHLARAVLSIVVFAAFVPAVWGQADVHGQWSTLPYLMPTNSVHAALLYNGKVLVIAGSVTTAGTQSLTAALWDPQAGAITTQSTTWYMFCNGMTALADGRILIVGGTIQSNPFLGSPKVAIYDPATNAFIDVKQPMAHGRWYPNVTLLSDGRVIAFSGLNETTGATNSTVEIYTVGTGWSGQYNAPFTPPLYPRMHLLPSGKVFFAGSLPTSYMFDPTSNTWSSVANTKSGINRIYGSSVLLPLTPANNYDPRVFILGGGQPTATPTTELIDFGAGSPSWEYGPDMTQARVEMVAVLLPTGKVLAMGGSATDEDGSTASLNADLYDPAANSFSSAGANVYPRMYHTEALLMPDATVWLAGSNPSTGVFEQHMEIYQPAYLFTRDGNNSVIAAPRPTISSAPGNISWGGQFTVTTPDAINITSALLMKPGSSTHGFDFDERQVGLNFTAGSGTLTVTGPPNANIAPPGYYMLFLINNHGVPSVAKFLLLGGSVAPPPPPPTGINLVQSNSVPTTLKASLTTVAAPFTASQTAGDLNVVVVGWGDVTSTVSTVTDGLGNKYSPAGTTATGTGLRQAIYYAKNIAAGSNTVTVTFSQAAAYPDLRILEYSGLDTSNPLDVTAAASGSGTTATSASATTTSPNELIFGAGNNGNGFNGPGAGFTLRMIDYYGNLAEDKAVGGSGSYNVTAPLKESTNWVMQMATFRANGQGSSNPAPTVNGVSPTSGTTAGGTPVTITGTGFLAGATVTFGTTAATGVAVASNTSITATTPAHAAGAVTVTVTNTDAQSGPLTNGFTYTTPANPAPTVTGVTPTSGTTAGGTPVTITGTGFLAGATVAFGTTAATSVTVVSSTSITATTPAHAAGAVNVVVTNTDAQSGALTGGYTYTSASGGGGIAFVQLNSGPNSLQHSLSSIGATFALPQTAGDLNVVVVGWGDVTSLVSKVTDSLGNMYTQAGGTATGSGLRQAIFFAKNIAAGSNTVTVTFNQAATYPDIRILEYGGLDTNNPLDGTSAAVGTGTTADSGAATTTFANDLIFGAGNNGDGFKGAGTGFTLRTIDYYGNIAEDEIVSSSGSYKATAPLQKSTNWVMQMVAFKETVN